MKKLLFITLLIAVVFSDASSKMSILIDKGLLSDNRETYELGCSGATGSAVYTVQGLPTGVHLQGNKIIIGQNAQTGNYILRITAKDANGDVANKIVNLGIVVTSGVSSSDSSFTSSSSSSSSSSLSSFGTSSTNGISGTSGTTGANDNNGNINISIGGGNSGTLGNLGISGAGGITIPSGGVNTNSQTTGSSTARLNQIITTYSSISDVGPVSYPGNRYPQPQFPTGNQPEVNPTTLLISTSQTQPSNNNRNTITADDVALKAASDRQQNAIKAITNLLTIIDQANANKNKAQADITIYTNAYNQAITGQRNAQQAIQRIEVTVTQITSAITNVNNQIADLQNRIGKSNGQRSVLIQQRTDLQSQIAGFNVNAIQSQIDAITSQIKQYQDQVSANQAKCSSITQQINDNKYTLTQLQQKLSNIDATIASLKITYSQKQSIVDDLQARLNAAIVDRDNTKKQLDKAIYDRTTLPDQISSLNNKITDLTFNFNSCSSSSSSIQKTIDDLNNQLDVLNKQLSDTNGKIKVIQTQITTITATITQIDNSNPDISNKLQELNNNLNFLKQQNTIYVSERNRLYQAGNDANTRVQYAKQNLDAVILRFNTQANNVKTGTYNLERARAEQQLAKKGLEQLIALYTPALPYAIVPNGNGNTRAGTPAGNNPSGSPLGPVYQGGDGAPGTNTVFDWVHYLSQAYGAGVSPAFSGSVTKLYPFTFSSIVNGNNVVNIRSASTGSSSSSTTGGCGGSANQPLSSITGTIVAVTDSSFDVQQDDGSIVRVGVAPCTSLNSNKSSYTIKSGDVAIAKGVKQGSNSLSSQSVTCLTE